MEQQGAVVIWAGGEDPARALLWRDAFNAWQSTLKSQSTKRCYRDSWRIFLSFIQKVPWRVGRADVVHWVTHLHSRPITDATIMHRLSAISSFYQFCMTEFTVYNEEGLEVPLFTHNPAGGKSIRIKISPFCKAVPLSADQLRLFLSVIPRNTVQGKRDYALFLAYIFTGRRNSEIRNLKWGDLEFRGDSVWYRWSGKNVESARSEMPDFRPRLR